MSGLHLNKGKNVLQASRFYIEDFLPFCLNCFYNVKANDCLLWFISWCYIIFKTCIDNSSYIVDLPNSRASCQKIIEEKVTPILAEIVAFVDTNSNTMILESSEKTWITGLWLGIFNIIDVEDIEKNTSGEHFSANFPFSWIIYGAVEKIFHVTSENAIGMHTILYVIFFEVNTHHSHFVSQRFSYQLVVLPLPERWNVSWLNGIMVI